MANKRASEAADMLRESAWSGTSANILCGVCESMGFSCGSTDCKEVASCLADKIDREVNAAARSALSRAKTPLKWIKREIEAGSDWPEPMQGETFAGYMERCFAPLPRFGDGSVVARGDTVEDLDGKVEMIDVSDVGYWTIYDETSQIEGPSWKRVERPGHVSFDGRKIEIGDAVWEIASGAKKKVRDFYGEYVITAPWGEVDCEGEQYPPSRLVYASADGLDGKPVRSGEKVWSRGGVEFTVQSVSFDEDCGFLVHVDDSAATFPTKSFTHERPEDTQADIDRDAGLLPHTYYVSYIADDPNDMKDMRDSEIVRAVTRDLLRRQRELDARESGGAE